MYSGHADGLEDALSLFNAMGGNYGNDELAEADCESQRWWESGVVDAHDGSQGAEVSGESKLRELGRILQARNFEETWPNHQEDGE